MTDTPPIRFFQRRYPSANSVLLQGPRPVLIDTGFGADAADLAAWLHRENVPPERLALVVNTHFHTDHAGGNCYLQSTGNADIAAHPAEAALVNAADPDACRAEWLRQPIEPYRVGRVLREGDRIDTGGNAWTVLETPGHTAGHLSLYSAALGVLVLGDALHDSDVGWISPYREGADMLERSRETIERLSRLKVHRAYSGHGGPILDPPAAFERARARLAGWAERPDRMAWHACKRIFTHALMVEGGIARDALGPFLLDAPWFRDHARSSFGLVPDAFVPLLLAEMVRSGAAMWRDGALVARGSYRKADPGWNRFPTRPADWPRTCR